MADDFYVGYLPTPRSHRKALLLGLPLALMLLVAAIVAMGVAQRDPGDGVWDFGGEPAVWEGTLVADPFPRLLTEDGAVFLVEFGKIGAQRRIDESLLGRHVRVSGWRVERDGRRIVELEPDVTIEDLGPGRVVSDVTPIGDRTFIGEILDSKCYLGAMKPGDGKAHKACATLCISGGIPPMLLVRDADGNKQLHIIVSESGDRADELILDLIAEPVRVTGLLEQRGDVSFLRVREVSRR